MKYAAIDEPALQALVERFYDEVRRDPTIGPVFNGAIDDWPDHLHKLQAFWSSVMLTSGRYKGQPLPAHVRHSDQIDARAFRRWLELWHEVTGAMFEAEPARVLREKAERIGESLQLGIRYAAERSRQGEATAGTAP